jgi:ribonuclease P protein component
MQESRPKKFKFPKAEKLTGKKKIEELFQNGSSIFLHPFLVKYLPAEEEVHRILISVPKKKFKRAVDRNLLKRRIREAYRLNKYMIYDQPETFYHVGFIYQDTKALAYSEIEEKLVILLKRLQDQKSNEKD